MKPSIVWQSHATSKLCLSLKGAQMFSLEGHLRSFNGFIKRVNGLNRSVRNKIRKQREVAVVRITNSPQITEPYSSQIIICEHGEPEHFVHPRQLSANHRTVCRVRTLVLFVCGLAPKCILLLHTCTHFRKN